MPPSHHFAIILALTMAAGCAGRPLEPDVLAVRNPSDAEATVTVEVLEQGGAVIYSGSLDLQAREHREVTLKRLSGPHVVTVSVGGNATQKEVSLGPIKEYINVELGASVQIFVLHGD